MPVSSYYKGRGRKVMASMKRRYGKQKGARVFYGKINNMRKGTKAERAAQPKQPPGSGRKRKKSG